MARISIENCWWTDPRRSALIRVLGKEELADGIALQAWRLAQEFWKKDRQLIPKALFEMLEFASALLQVGLAEVREDKVYVRGSSVYLEWINQSKESGRIGGRISAQRPRDEKGRLLPKETQESSKGGLDKSPTGSKGLQTSSSSSSSNTNTLVPKGTTLLWNYYREQLKKQKDLETAKAGIKENTHCKKLIEEFGLEKAKELVLVFLQDKDPFVISAAYQIGLLFSQRQKYLARCGKLASTERFTFVDSTEVKHA